MNLNHCCSTTEKEVNLRHVLRTTSPPRYGKFSDDLAESPISEPKAIADHRERKTFLIIGGFNGERKLESNENCG